MDRNLTDFQPGLSTSAIVGTMTFKKTGTTARIITFPDAAITVARADAAQTLTGAQTVQAAATQDAVSLAGRAGGTGSYVATITPQTLAASITITLPAITSTLAVLGANTFTGAQIFQDQITTEAVFRAVASVASAAGTTVLDATSHVLVITGSTTQAVTLPAAAIGREIIIKNRSTGNVTVTRAGSDTIDGSAASVVLTNGDYMRLIANTTDWVDVS